jgi:hypothetical protein
MLWGWGWSRDEHHSLQVSTAVLLALTLPEIRSLDPSVPSLAAL